MHLVFLRNSYRFLTNQPLPKDLFSSTISVSRVGGNPLGKVVSKVIFLPFQEGQGLVEYALILVLVAIVVIAIMLLLGPTIGNVFSNIIAVI
jgi:pilus assembly protein Flp/PilA